MTTTLAIVETKEKIARPKRERIGSIETTPQDHWFVRSKTPRGREVWYLRFEMTGMNARLFGPFKSKRQSLLCLDDAIGGLSDWSSELTEFCEKRMVKEECQSIWPPIVEYPILAQARLHTEKGR